MALKKIKLGKYIHLFSCKCNVPNLTNDEVSGVNKDKEFFEPSTQVGSDTSKYKIVPPNYFACNLMHVGRDKVLPIAFNHSENNKIVSPAYFVFKFAENSELLSDYFFIFLKSNERDRYFWFNTDGSVRDGMSWEDFIDVEIELPPIEIQQKYVNIYKGMLENQRAYETGLEDLKLVCDATIEDLRRKYSCERIGKYIHINKELNSDEKIKKIVGLYGNDFKSAKTGVGEEYGRFQIIKHNSIVYPPPHFGKIGTIGLYKGEDALISPMYVSFSVNDEKILNPNYLMMWLLRPEFFRWADFMSCDSIRDTFDFSKLCEFEIPIPSIEIQRDIVDIFNVYNERKQINEILKSQIKDICPILIKGAMKEGNYGTKR